MSALESVILLYHSFLLVSIQVESMYPNDTGGEYRVPEGVHPSAQSYQTPSFGVTGDVVWVVDVVNLDHLHKGMVTLAETNIVPKYGGFQ